MADTEEVQVEVMDDMDSEQESGGSLGLIVGVIVFLILALVLSDLFFLGYVIPGGPLFCGSGDKKCLVATDPKPSADCATEKAAGGGIEAAAIKGLTDGAAICEKATVGQCAQVKAGESVCCMEPPADAKPEAKEEPKK